MQEHIKIKPIISTLALTIGIFYVILLLGKVLIPFLIALILSYIVNPFVEKIQNKCKIKRSIISFMISILIFLIFISIPVFLLPNILIQIKSIISEIPTLINVINVKLLNVINVKYDTHLTLDYNMAKSVILKNIGTLYNHVNIFSPLAHNSIVLVEILVYIILIPFILFYSTNNWGNLLKFFDDLIPKRYKDIVHQVITDIDRLLAAYLRGQISVMFIMALYYSIALNIIGLNSATLIGTITGLLVFIPYLGILTGLFISLAVGFTDFTSMNLIFWILGVFVVGHLLEGGLITPFLVGGKIGLNPIMIIFALMVFGKLFGVVGVLLALPLSTIAVVLLRYVRKYYIHTNYYNEETS